MKNYRKRAQRDCTDMGTWLVRQNVNKHGDKTNYMQEIPNLLTKPSCWRNHDTTLKQCTHRWWSDWHNCRRFLRRHCSCYCWVRDLWMEKTSRIRWRQIFSVTKVGVFLLAQVTISTMESQRNMYLAISNVPTKLLSFSFSWGLVKIHDPAALQESNP